MIRRHTPVPHWWIREGAWLHFPGPRHREEAKASGGLKFTTPHQATQHSLQTNMFMHMHVIPWFLSSLCFLLRAFFAFGRSCFLLEVCPEGSATAVAVTVEILEDLH